jgi:predicted ATPase
VISSSTRRLTGGLFHYRDLGAVALEGFADSVPAWQALGASAAESRFEALRASTTPLVGRGEEIDLLLRRWSKRRAGQEGLSLITRGLTAVRAAGTVAHTPHLFTGLAEAHARLGQPVEGLNCLAEAAGITETTEERYHEAELHRLRGDLLNATGDPSAAERSYHRALDVAKRQSAKLFELRASISLARLWCKQGKRGEARDLLASTYNWFTEGFGTPVLDEAKVLLQELAQ